ncbi:MAG: hypothetical protein R6W73_00975 [Candidatus Saliniplasma sp.]
MIPLSYAPEDGQFAGTTGLNIETEIASVEGYDTTTLDILKSRSNANNMTDGPMGGDEDDDRLKETQEFVIRYAAGRIDQLGLIDIGEFVYQQTKPRGGSDEMILEDIEAEGEGDSVRHHWVAPFYEWDYDPPRERFYSGGTLMQLDTGPNPPNSVTLNISANNEIGVYDLLSEDFMWGPVDSEETSFEIDIKNAKPDVENVDVDDVTTSESSGDNSIHPDIYLDLDNKAGCEVAKYDVDIEYKYSSSYEYVTTRTVTIEDSGDPLPAVEMTIPEDFDGDIDIRLIITAKDEYGGWETLETTTFHAENDSDSGGGGGGGGTGPPPPCGVSPMGNNTWLDGK